MVAALTMASRWIGGSALLPALWLTALGLLPAPAAAAERGMLQVTTAASEDDPDGARVLVKYKALGGLMRAQAVSGARGPQHAAAMATRLGLALTDGRVVDRRTQVLRGGKGLSSAALAARLAADADVEYAVPDRRRHALALPTDPLFAASALISPAAGQWYLRAPDATFVSAINATAAWSVTTGSASVVVADLDTGVLFSHPDLASKLYAGYDFVAADSGGAFTTAGDGNGRDSDATDPGDGTNASASCGASNSSWHGTKTAGLIGAQTDNGIGMASVGYHVMVLPVRVLGKCGGYDSDIIAAMLWAGGLSSLPVANPHPARVINLSLGSSGSCSAGYADAVSQLTAAGVVVVAAAGNADGLAVSTPANCSGVIAVAGLRHAGTKVGYSNVGPQVALGAPAGNCVNDTGACLYPILTTTNSGTSGAAVNTYSNDTNYTIGTSFSAPLVSGTVALMLSANPALTPSGVKSLLQATARAYPTTSADPTVPVCHAPNGVPQGAECLCTSSTCGAGMLDAGAAVAAAAVGATPTASIVPSSTTLTAGGTVTLDGSASAASGRSIVAYQWAITSGSGVAALTGGSSGATTTVTTLTSGSFTVQLTVTDSAGQQATTSVTLNVNAAAAPTVSLLASADTVAAGAAVSFDGSASTGASGLTIVGYQWSITSGAALASFSSATNAATASVQTSGTGAGSFTVQLTVTDSAGRSSASSVGVNVTALAPTASIGASASTVTVGGSIALDGSGSLAPTGRSIAGYQWTITSGSDLASLSQAGSASASLLASGAGTVVVSLTVTDSAGATASVSQTLSVSAAPVVVTAPATSGGGGGAMGGGWVLGLAVAVAVLRRSPARRAAERH